MGTGPILILDKSTFQMLSAREHSRRAKYFFDNVTPILVTEILGDLSKALDNGRDPAAKVAELASKFQGSGGPVNHDASLLAVQALIGNDIPMTGQVLAQGGREVHDPQLGRGFFVDLTWWNEAILRWSHSQFSDVEKQTSALWRIVTRQPGFSSLWQSIQRHRIVLPKIASVDELAPILEEITTDGRLQNQWFEILLDRLHVTDAESSYVRRRWAAADQPLSTFAPYAHHCLKVWVALVMVVHHRLFKWAPTHLVDLQYLNYLPFCQVFSSNDKLHRLLAPILKRQDQTFLTGDELKATLKAEADGWDDLTDGTRERLRWALSSPLPRRDSLLFQTWVRYCNPAPGGNRVCHLDPDERQRALEEAREMLLEVWVGRDRQIEDPRA